MSTTNILNSRIKSLKDAIKPENVLNSLPEIKKASVWFKPSDEDILIDTPFKGFVNRFEDGKVIPVKVVKSKRYSELDHKKTFETVVKELEKMGEDLCMYKMRGNGDCSVITSSIIIEKPFSLNEVPFEFKLNTKPDYISSSSGEKNKDVFYPMVTITNSFLGCSEVTFDLFRSICANGIYMGKVLSKSVRFRHFGDVISEFNKSTEQFIVSIFEKRFINKIFDEYNKKTIEKEKFESFMGRNLGKRIAKEITEDLTFNLPSVFTAWIGLQVLTYYTSHKLKNQSRATTSMKAFIEGIQNETF